MKFIHLSDLHIGKVIDKMRMLEDQEHILGEILKITESEKPDAVLIAGDVYDRGVPPAEAVLLFDSFLTSLSKMRRADGSQMQTFVISGNHDSPERLAFGRALIESGGVHISPVFNGCVEPFVMHDEFGEVLIYMLPFIKPAHVRDVLRGDDEAAESVVTYTDAIAKAVEMISPEEGKRSVLLSHQFVVGAARSDSETRSVGGLDEVDISVYEPFNYVALGHLHRPQSLSTRGGNRNVVCYAGSPLKYSFSENEQKSAAVVTIDGEGSVSVERIPLVPLRDMRTVEGSFGEIMKRGEHSDDYIRVMLSDEHIPSHVYHDLRSLYPNIITTVMSSQRASMQSGNGLIGADVTAQQDELEIVGDFFSLINGRGLSQRETDIMKKIIEIARGSDRASEGTVNEDAAD